MHKASRSRMLNQQLKQATPLRWLSRQPHQQPRRGRFCRPLPPRAWRHKGCCGRLQTGWRGANSRRTRRLL
eukprot:3238221-Prorocentrum_lima.AAC.1